MLATNVRNFQKVTIGSVDQRATKLQTVKVGGLEKMSANHAWAAQVRVPDDQIIL